MSKVEFSNREKNLYKKLLKCYECKQYRNGIKISKQILDVFPNHGETISIKGLCLYGIGKKEQGEKCVKEGLRYSINSDLCWRVYGLIHRYNRRYSESLKCYRNAIKMDAVNLTVLRDSAAIEIHLREFDNFRETRQKLLLQSSTKTACWVGYSLGYYFCGDYKNALCVFDSFNEDNTDYKSLELCEKGNIVLYCVKLYMLNQEYQNALNYIYKSKDTILDHIQIWKVMVEILQKLNRFEDCLQVYSCLLNANPHCMGFIKGFIDISKIVHETKNSVEVLCELSSKYPSSVAIQKMLILASDGENLKMIIRKMVYDAAKRSQFSLVEFLSFMYKDSYKMQMLHTVLNEICKTIENNYILSPYDNVEETVYPKTFELCIYYYMACNDLKLKNYDLALSFTSKCRQHTPNFVEVIELEVIIHHQAHDNKKALELAKFCQSLDYADRFLNQLYQKSLLLNNEIEDALLTMHAFSRDNSNPIVQLADMQCLWFITMQCEAEYRRGRLDHSLKYCHQIFNIFVNIINDQIDFHSYCLVKYFINAYIDFIHYEDTAMQHYSFKRASELAVKIYLEIYDGSENFLICKMKKIKIDDSILTKTFKSCKRNKPIVDIYDKPTEILEPNQYFSTKTPLIDCLPFLKNLILNFPDDLHTNYLAYKVYKRIGNLQEIFKYLKNCIQIDENHYYTHECIYDVLTTISNNLNQTEIDALPQFLQNINIIQLVDNWRDKNKNSIFHQYIYSKCDKNVEKFEENLYIILKDMVDNKSKPNCSDYVHIYKEIQSQSSLNLKENVMLHFKNTLHKIFPLLKL
ncbi:N-alpha-acetyltransferase 16, NatA auxiliary subunit [Intoshia linei]|uniref:N-alpha-acetyltransferase 16, NatA auxiliary subunit n=1 Tax=Intoshia linei TaxID=1819745 RepID=A0A177BBJ5_9BILA|nr:N-alpha-acetyltransferase 16, NatA auxiliary subunit [Intoshia linei]